MPEQCVSSRIRYGAGTMGAPPRLKFVDGAGNKGFAKERKEGRKEKKKGYPVSSSRLSLSP